jgi:hypothetical protein
MSKAFSVHAFVIAISLAAAASAADSSESWMPWPFHHDEPAGKPDRVTALWNDAVANTAGQPPVRGFGGRLMFYESKGDTPVKIDGTLIVYAFDETNRDPNNCKPDCKYVFTPEQLPKHYSKTKVGHSYSVWLPWDMAGGMQKEITLIVRFEPKLGAPIVGDQCKEILPGLLPPAKLDSVNRLPAIGGPAGIMAGGLGNRAFGNGGSSAGAPPAYYGAPGQAPDGVRAASYDQPVPQNGAQQYGAPAGQVIHERRMTTATIEVPDGLLSREVLSAPAAGPGPAMPTRDQRPANGYGGAQYAPPPSSPANARPAQIPAWRAGQPAEPSAPPQAQYPARAQNPQPQAGFGPPRPWAPSEQYARPNPDRARWQQPPAAQPYAPANQPWGANPNAALAAPTSAPQ